MKRRFGSRMVSDARSVDELDGPRCSEGSSAMNWRILMMSLVAFCVIAVVSFGSPQTKSSGGSGGGGGGASKKETAGEAVSFGLGVALGLAGEGGVAPSLKSAADSAPKKDAARVKTESATFGGGCFWSMEAIFERIPGVKNVVSGFAGGSVARPLYEEVLTGLTGHAEVVRIEFDPKVVTYDQLLKIYFSAHDPTTLNRQGEDEGTNYRSVILYHNNEQKDSAQKMYMELTQAGMFGSPIVTELVPMNAFYPADRHHQDYYRKHRTSHYCQMVIAPKLMKLHLNVK
jgi:peptide-methionine (S)-S-oxide reductase